MAYEMFRMLSTYNLEEIEKEDIEKIITDCQWELTRRDRVVKNEAIAKFREAFDNLYNTGVTLSCWVNTEEWEGNIYIDDIDIFTFG